MPTSRHFDSLIECENIAMNQAMRTDRREQFFAGRNLCRRRPQIAAVLPYIPQQTSSDIGRFSDRSRQNSSASLNHLRCLLPSHRTCPVPVFVFGFCLRHTCGFAGNRTNDRIFCTCSGSRQAIRDSICKRARYRNCCDWNGVCSSNIHFRVSLLLSTTRFAD